MSVRPILVALTTAALLPFGGASHASCLDDLTATNLHEGTRNSGKSEYWMLGYVEVGGTANLSVHGDALASDYAAYGGDWVRWAPIFADNAADAAAAFAGCVAG